MEWKQQIMKKINLGAEVKKANSIAPLIRNKIKNLMENHPEVEAPEPLQISGNYKENWRNFRQQFQDYLKTPVNDIKSSEEKVKLLLNVIGPEGLELYKTFKLDEVISTKIDLVLACFEEHFKKKNNIVHERFMFNKRVQGKDESFESFLNDILLMIETCGYGDQEEDILRDKIVFGVNDENLQLKLIYKEVDLDKAIELCRSHSTLKQKKLGKQTEGHIEGNKETKPDVSNTDAHSISSDSETEDIPRISYCVGNFKSEVSGSDSRSESPKCNGELTKIKTEVHKVKTEAPEIKEEPPNTEDSEMNIVITNVHTLSESDSQEFVTFQKNKSVVTSDSDENESNEAPKKFSRIKPFGSIMRPIKKSGNGKRKADSPPRERIKKKVKKSKRSEEIEDVDDWSDNVYDSDADSDKEVSNKMSLSQRKVFEFFNSATLTELLQVPTCTEKKANSIMESRPFENWRDLVNKMESGKHLTGNLLNCALDVLKTRTIVSKLMEKCLNLAISTEKAISAGLTSVKEQPSILAPGLELKSYQMVGLNWFVAMHHQNLSGILADEMGLGKTIQVIAFLSYLHEHKESKHPHLIVVPATTLENWAVEFSKWSPSLRVVVYHGHPDDRRALRVQWFKDKFSTMDVIITTYNIISSNYEEKKMFRVISLDYVVFDEAHMLKNMNAQRYGHLFSINAQKRILLTGTPLQNNLLELMSLLNFVMPDMFANRIQYIKTFFSKNNKVQGSSPLSFEQEQVDLAKQIMKPFVLRRLKDDVLSDLPTKTSTVIKCPLIEDQKTKYDEFLSNMKEWAEKDRENYNYMSSFMQLRRLANHPLACRYLYQDDQLLELAERLSFDMDYKGDNKDHIFEDLAVMSDFEIHELTQTYKCISKFKLQDESFLESGKFKKLDELLPKLKEGGHRVLIFSQFVFMLDILEEYLRIREHDYLRLDGSTKSLDRQDLIDNYNEDSNIFIFLLTTKAGGIGINLTTADTVIIHDIDFNPYNDKQAEDRCHRLGQTKPVHIMRLLSEGTVEEYIYAKAQHKLNLEQELISTEESEETKNVEDLLKEVLGITV